jgi:biopolymer transport protein ExbD
MKNLFVCSVFFSTLIFCACNTNTPKTPTEGQKTGLPESALKRVQAMTNGIYVSNKGEITVFRKTVSLDNIKSVLADSFSNLGSIPSDLPIDFEDDVLMGTRQEVKTQVAEASAKVKLYHVLMSDKGEDMVKNFYAWYIDKLNGTTSYVLERNKSDAESLLTPELFKSLQKVDKSEDGSGSDYFLKAQDWGKDWGTVEILSSKTEGSTVTCKVKLGTGKESIGFQNLIVTVQDRKAGWNISKVEAAESVAPSGKIVGAPTKIIVTVNEAGKITIGDKVIELDNLKKVLADRYNAVKHGAKPVFELKMVGDVPMGIRGDIRDIFAEIKK